MSDRADDAARSAGDDPRTLLVAYALGETSASERAAVERALADDPSLAAELDEIRALIAAGRTSIEAVSASYRTRRDDMLATLSPATSDAGSRRSTTARRRAHPSGGGSLVSIVGERWKRSIAFRVLVGVAAVQIGILVYLVARDDGPKPVDEVATKLLPKVNDVAETSPRRLADPDDEGLPDPDRLPAAPIVVQPEDDADTSGLDDIGIGHGFQSREVAVARFDAAKRAAALARWGGSNETEAAVSRGLAYLRGRQRDDGSFAGDAAAGGAVRETALSVLAFLGRTLDDADRRAVGRGVAFLLANQRASGCIAAADESTPATAMTHALATQCLVEARAMVPGAVDDEARVQRALAWFAPARLTAPRAVTQAGITLMVAGNLNFDVPRDVASHCRRWFDRAENRARFESSDDAAERTFFAAGRVLFGGKATPSKVVSDLLAARPDGGTRRRGDLVAWLYAAQALRLRGPSRSWARWNDAMVAALLPTQDAEGRFVARGEPAATALGVLLFETYYRYGAL